MGRLFTSELDRFLKGDQFVDLMNKFYDGVDRIQAENGALLPDGISLDSAFEFDTTQTDEGNVEIVFNDKYDLPESIMTKIVSEFQEVFRSKQ